MSAMTIQNDLPAAAQDDNAALIERYISAISGKDKPASLLDTYMTDAALKQHIEYVESKFPRYVMVVEDVVAQADKVAVRARFKGSPASAPTKSVNVPFMVFYRIAGAKIAEHWIAIDPAEMQRQLA